MARPTLAVLIVILKLQNASIEWREKVRERNRLKYIYIYLYISLIIVLAYGSIYCPSPSIAGGLIQY